MSKQQPNLMPLAAMARCLNIRPQDLRTAVEADELPCIRVGEALLFDPEAVQRALLKRARPEGQGDENGQ